MAETSINTLLGTLGLTPYAGGGYGVTVALIDSGIHPSASFGNRIKAFYDFTNGGTRQKPSDDYGHGTHVAGLIGGLQYREDTEFQGIAPSVQFVGLKVLDRDGSGRTTDVIRAIEFAIANRRKFGIHIINLSLGHPIFEPAATDPLVQAVEKATQAGIIVVASAGNHGIDANGDLGFAGITSPGNAPSAITVGAADHNASVTRRDDRMAVYSSSGPTWYDGLVKPDVVAPGQFLASESSPASLLAKTYPKLLTRGKSGKKFLQLSGTSMAAGVTTSVVALLKQAMPAMTPNLAKGVLQYTAIPLKDERGAAYNALRQGTGEINAAGAVKLASRIRPGVRDLETKWVSVAPTTTIGGRAYPWAGNIVWGESVYYNLPVWGLNVVWGDNIVWGENIVWGDNLVQQKDHTNVYFANDNIVWGSLVPTTRGKGGR